MENLRDLILSLALNEEEKKLKEIDSKDVEKTIKLFLP